MTNETEAVINDLLLEKESRTLWDKARLNINAISAGKPQGCIDQTTLVLARIV